MFSIRRLHSYVGLIIAPSVLFFALSGFLQIFSLHESRAGYQAPALLKVLGNLHKDQVLFKPERRHGGGAMASLGDARSGKERANAPAGVRPTSEQGGGLLRTYLLKWVFALVALGLMVSTGLGVWMALRFTRAPRLSWALLGLGVLTPLLIILI